MYAAPGNESNALIFTVVLIIVSYAFSSNSFFNSCYWKPSIATVVFQLGSVALACIVAAEEWLKKEGGDVKEAKQTKETAEGKKTPSATYLPDCLHSLRRVVGGTLQGMSEGVWDQVVDHRESCQAIVMVWTKGSKSFSMPWSLQEEEQKAEDNDSDCCCHRRFLKKMPRHRGEPESKPSGTGGRGYTVPLYFTTVSIQSESAWLSVTIGYQGSGIMGCTHGSLQWRNACYRISD
ncbi:hypothetical protein INR49_030562 [Caranx melampygus]|nr:hypothetical protein INR49_030562 [Caranx melampygus]